MKYQRSTTFGCKDIIVRESEFVAKTQFLCLKKTIGKKHGLALPRQNVTPGKMLLGKKLPSQNVTKAKVN